jgi:hypothetical protein
MRQFTCKINPFNPARYSSGNNPVYFFFSASLIAFSTNGSIILYPARLGCTPSITKPCLQSMPFIGQSTKNNRGTQNPF